MTTTEDKARESDRWSEGVCADGAAILRDGEPMDISALLAYLNWTEFQGAELVKCYHHARRLAEALGKKHFPDNPDWRPLEDIRGVVDQIDNMTTALVHKDALRSARNEALEDAARVAQKIADETAADWRQGGKASIYLEGWSVGADDAAIAIRSLKQDQASDSPATTG
jgi:hypothetical protein